MGKRKTIDDYHLIGKDRGIQWLGEQLPRNVTYATQWRCQHGHEWETAYESLQQGRGCKICSRLANKRQEADYHEVGRERGIRWVGETLPKNVDELTPWECEEGHRWMARFAAINSGRGCRICSHAARRKKPEDYHAAGKDRGIEWIGETVPNSVDVLTRWKCVLGHEWMARYSNINRGRGCPRCAGRKTFKS